ncbi:MAG: antibiotic biosynthesis monooxygenase [Gammaproteobacteria bacterium]|nr:antibiotic biosynthesis monooxygenase [Gammaproteobacteria bacterium]
MYAVIFRAKTGVLDEEYGKTVAKMRELAFEKYGCIDFIAVTEGKDEIAISYWKDEASIRNWKSDSEHALAQEYGRDKWYESYIVQVVEVKREYAFNL